MTAEQSARAQDTEFLNKIRMSGNSERILAIGDFLMQKMGMEMPRRLTKFTYGHYNANGEVTAAERVPLQHNVNVPPGMRQQKGSSADTFDTTNQIEGSYQFFVNGVSFVLVRGRDDGTQVHQVTREEIVVVVPETQNIFGKVAQVDPMSDPEHFLWLWMHPRNLSAPCNLSAQEANRYGIEIRKANEWLLPNKGPRLKMNAGSEAKHRIMENTNEAARLTAKVRDLNDADLKRLALATGVRPLEIADETVPMPQVWRTHLYNVINDISNLKTAIERKAKLSTLLDGGDEYVRKIISRAINIGALEQVDTEFYLVDLEGKQSQPDVLPRYVMHEEETGFGMDWLAMKLEHDKRESLVNIIDNMAVQHENKRKQANGGRELSAEQASAIDRAVLLGKIVEVQTTNKGNGNWQLADGEVLCTWKGMSKEDKIKQLYTWASSFEFGSVLLKIGLAEDAS